MTEFALVLPLLVGIVVVIVQAGIALNHYLRLTDAVRAGARAASVTHDAAAAGTAAASASGGLVAPGDVRLSATDWSPGDSVTVSASVPYSVDIFGITVLSGSLSSSTTQRIE
jgi:Flp pilus assembly protein TadG